MDTVLQKTERQAIQDIFLAKVYTITYVISPVMFLGVKIESCESRKA